jgi:hypothetical protein
MTGCAVACPGMQPTRAELEAASCWETVDRVAHDPKMTAFKRRARYQQASWRERHRLPIGHQPVVGGGGARLLGSRLELEYAKETGGRRTVRAARRSVRRPGQRRRRRRTVAG